uniref:Piscidin 4 n=1 Tax=Anabas testudineus TaxID=64144 RepID=A0A3Q1JEA4_ANATE
MKYLVMFLVLTLVIFMAEPGEGLFGGWKAAFRGGRRAFKAYKYNRAMDKMARKYGPNWKQGLGSSGQQPADSGEAPAEGEDQG